MRYSVGLDDIIAVGMDADVVGCAVSTVVGLTVGLDNVTYG